jgi:hypothetical protein
MTQVNTRHGWASLGILTLLVALNQAPHWLAGTRLAWYAEQVYLRLTTANGAREDLDELLAGYYEALVRKGTTLTTGPGFLQHAYRPHTINVKRPGQQLTNSFAMFDREYTREKPPGARRLALIGDSISIGEFGRNFESLLEDRLNRNHRTPAINRFEVLNLAVEGYRITQLVDVAWRRAPIFQPDVYLVTLTRLSVARRWSFHIGRLVQQGADLQYGFLRQIAAEAGLRPTDSLSRIDRKLARFHQPVLRWSLSQLRDAAAANNARLVFILLPWTIADPTIEAHYQDALRELQALRLSVIDLRDSFAGYADMRLLRISREDYHPNTRGHQIMADKLYSQILTRPELSQAILGEEPR